MNRIYAIALLALLWVVWCFLHSLLISRSVTKMMQDILGPKYGYYRLAYNIFSFVSLLPVIYYHFRLDEKIIFAWPWPWSLLKIGLYVAAFLLFYGGYRVYDMRHMLGLRQIRTMRHATEPAEVAFTTRGILAYVRHPWYTGAILLIWAFGDITDVSLVVKIVLTVYVVTGTVLEEKKLIQEFGQPYIDYCRRVPMLIPWKIFTVSHE